MDEDKKTKDEQEADIPLQDGKNEGDGSSPVSLRNIGEKTDTSAAQDLLESMGLGFLKSKKILTSEWKKKNLQKDIAVSVEENSDVEEETLQQVQIKDIVRSNVVERNPVEDESPQSDEDVDSCNQITEEEEIILGGDSGIFPEMPEVREKEPVKKGFRLMLLVIPALILVTFMGYKLYGFITEPRPPSEDVVATYSGKDLTKEELMTYINSRGYKEQEHGLCEKHGFDHSKCDKTEKCEIHPIHSLEAYNQIIKMIAVQNMVDNWAKENGVTQKDQVQHDLKHLVEEVSLDSLVDKVHQDQLSPDKIDKLEVQQYYDANRDKYKDKPFSEVEEEIRNILAAEKDKQFFPEYIEKLKKNAGLSVNYDILKVDMPTDTEMRSFYGENKDKYVEPGKVKILEIKVDISGSGDEARKKADEALTRINGGESFESVASKYSSADKFDAYYVNQGEKGANFDDKVFSLQVNELSGVIKDGDSFFIVKVLEKQEKRQKTLNEVLDSVKTEVLKEKEDRQYDLKKDEAIFSIHGKRFTLGEFKTEFKELAPETQAQFSSFEAKKGLIDQLIAKELLLEETGDDSGNNENNQEIEELKSQYISQMLHKEKIDEKIGEISEEEIKKSYEKNKSLLVDPPKAQISLIRVEQGGSDAEKSRARQRIDEALQKIKTGTDFGAAAKEYSSDWTASAGGELNEWVYYDEYLDPVLKQNIFNLNKDEVSNVFEYEEGFYIVKLRQKEEKKQRTLEEVQEEIKHALMDEKHQKMEDEMEDELFRNSKLVIYNSSLKKLLKEQIKTDQ